MDAQTSFANVSMAQLTAAAPPLPSPIRAYIIGQPVADPRDAEIARLRSALNDERERCAAILEREARGWSGELRPSDLAALAGLLRSGV